jgi:excisionase family DNA binding protein
MSASTSMLPKYHTIKDVAERWRVSTKTVRRLVDRGELAIYRIGGQLRISNDDLITCEKLHREWSLRTKGCS